jgi:hypothetical protein
MIYSGGNEGIFISEIGYATSQSLYGPWEKQSSGPIFLKGEPGEWDSQYVGFNYIIFDQSSSTYKMWYTGGAADWDSKIGYATAPVVLLDTLYVPGDYSTIQEAIDAAIDGNTILVADGTYYENINYKGKAITVASHFLIDGDSTHIENTIIDGSQALNPDSASVVEFNSNEDSTSVLCGFTITGGTGTDWGYYIYGGGIILTDASPIIRNNIIEYNTLSSETIPLGGSAIALGLYSDKTLIIENNIIRNNLCETSNSSLYINGTIYIHQTHGTVIFRENYINNNLIDGEYISNGGAISGFGNNSVSGSLIIENNIITQNIVDEGTASTAQLGGGLFLESYIAFVRNNIIAFNSARGGGGFWYYTPSPNPLIKTTLENNLIYGNIAGSRQGGGVSTHHDYEINNCIIWGNTSPQYNYQQVATINWSNIEEAYPIGSNNISLDPEFLDSTYFFLSSTSPCIDMGNPDPIYNDVEDPNNPGFALYPAQGTLRNDVGHFGGPNSNWSELIVTSVDEDESDNLTPKGFALSQNYPNPFNPSTTIKYGIKERSFVELKVYDILGREIASLINEEQNAGYHEINFNASKLSSGVYLYQLKAGQFIETKKMLLLK